MAHKITRKYLKKTLFTIKQKCIKQKQKRLRVYVRALVYVADTVDIIFVKFA